MSIDKELIWVSKDVADAYKAAESEETKEAIVRKVIESKKIDIEQDLQSLDETVLRFQSACITHKNALKKVYLEQDQQLYTLWEQMGDFESKVTRHSKEVAAKTSSATEAINESLSQFEELKKQYDRIDTYHLERFLEAVRAVTNLSDSSKDMVGFLMNNFTKTTKTEVK